LGEQVRRLLHPRKPSAAKPDPPSIPMPPGFDADAYLKANPDVAASGMDAAKHWLEFGQREGRPLR